MRARVRIAVRYRLPEYDPLPAREVLEGVGKVGTLGTSGLCRGRGTDYPDTPQHNCAAWRAGSAAQLARPGAGPGAQRSTRVAGSDARARQISGLGPESTTIGREGLSAKSLISLESGPGDLPGARRNPPRTRRARRLGTWGSRTRLRSPPTSFPKNKNSGISTEMRLSWASVRTFRGCPRLIRAGVRFIRSPYPARRRRRAA